MSLRTALGCLCLALLGACAQPSTVDAWQPEAASGWQAKERFVARQEVAVAAHPLAAQAGADILRGGGSAVDAAIAMQMVLTLVEPQSSGIGGGAFMLHHDGKSLEAWDGRETAPSAATPQLFLGPDGKPMPFGEAVVGGRSVGVPGVLAMLAQAHQRHGRLPWSSLFEPAIQLCEQGFIVSPRLASLLARTHRLREDREARSYFFDREGKPWPAGHRLRNPALAKTLRKIALEGPDAFYRGELAAAIAEKVESHARNPGLLRRADLAAYRARLREPVCADHKRWQVCGMPPPSSGGIAVLQMLGILDRVDIAGQPPEAGKPTPQAVHLFSEAGRLVYADRARYVADSDFVPLPGGSPEALIDPAYLAQRSTKIGQVSMVKASAGQPLPRRLAAGEDASAGSPSTSHLVVLDSTGNAVSMTSSIERAFGAQLMVGGFLLNNELTDFSFLPADADGPVANRVEPGKRPRSAMAPTMVFERGSKRLVLALGSPGGPAIINYVARSLVGVLDWRLPLDEVVAMPNFGSRNGPTELERGRFDPAFVHALQERGHVVVEGEQTSGLHGIQRVPGGWLAGVDPRREGAAAGD